MAILVGGYCHYHLAKTAYQGAPVQSEFYTNAVASLVLGIVVIVGPRRLAALGGLGLSAVTLIGFGLSRIKSVGVPSFHLHKFTETGLEPSNIHVFGVKVALLTLIVEGLAVVLCAAVLVGRQSPADVRRVPAHA